MIITSIHRQDLSGTWFMTKDGATYSNPMFIEFKDGQIFHYEVKEKNNAGFLEKKLLFQERFSETKNEMIMDNRIRLYRMGKTITALSETESRVEETEFATDYEKIEPTITDLTDKQIQELEFKVTWKNENFRLVFNKTLDSPIINKVNRRLGRKGRKIILEKLNETYFGSVYDNGYREDLIPIKAIDLNRVILYGFPEEPYEVIGQKE